MRPLRKLGFLTIGLFDGDDPRPGHESTLEIIELGERLGFDSAWVRHRHLQYGISSPVAVLAAASQRTSRIELGTAVIPLGWENPLRLAEDLATVDILSGGRLNPGVSVGPPMHYDQVKDALYPDTADVEDFSYERVRAAARTSCAASPPPTSAAPRASRCSPTGSSRTPPAWRERMWYGGASLRSAQWAGEHGMNFLTSSVVKAEESEDFAEIQLSHIRAFRAHHPDGDRARVSQGLVVIPTDTATPEQRAKYARVRGEADAAHRRAAGPGPDAVRAPTWSARSDEIAEQLYAHAAFREIDEVAFALPFTFEHEDYVQILTDMATRLGPALGWQPGLDRVIALGLTAPQYPLPGPGRAELVGTLA